MAVKGVLLSIEALFAAGILFAMLITISNLSAMPKDYSSQSQTLRDYAQGILLSTFSDGTLQQAAFSSSSSRLRQSLNSLPPELCVQINIYNSTPLKNSLNFTYIAQNCTLLGTQQSGVSYIPLIQRVNSSNQKFYWAEATAYMRG
ncbi:MAG: hypothetical protein WC492_03975 [Candidatus Micrarchaeia archaeon]